MGSKEIKWEHLMLDLGRCHEESNVVDLRAVMNELQTRTDLKALRCPPGDEPRSGGSLLDVMVKLPLASKFYSSFWNIYLEVAQALAEHGVPTLLKLDWADLLPIGEPRTVQEHLEEDRLWNRLQLALVAGLQEEVKLLTGPNGNSFIHVAAPALAMIEGWPRNRIRVLHNLGATTRLVMTFAWQAFDAESARISEQNEKMAAMSPETPETPETPLTPETSELLRVMVEARQRLASHAQDEEEEDEEFIHKDDCSDSECDGSMAGRLQAAKCWHHSESTRSLFIQKMLASIPTFAAMSEPDFFVKLVDVFLFGPPVDMSVIQSAPSSFNPFADLNLVIPQLAVPNEQTSSDEDAAEIHMQEANRIAAEQWATWTESHIQAGAHLESHGPQGATVQEVLEPPYPMRDFEPLHLLRLTRNPLELDRHLHEGPVLETLRAALIEAGHGPRLASGASIFVAPDQYEGARQAVARENLRPYHVIVSDTFRPLVEEALSSIPSRRNVRIRTEHPVAYISTHGDSEGVWVVERTFFEDVPQSMRNPSSVTRSTGDVHGAPNPRRRRPEW